MSGLEIAMLLFVFCAMSLFFDWTGQEGKIMIVECQDVATSAVTRDFQCFLSLASLRLISG